MHGAQEIPFDFAFMGRLMSDAEEQEAGKPRFSRHRPQESLPLGYMDLEIDYASTRPWVTACSPMSHPSARPDASAPSCARRMRGWTCRSAVSGRRRGRVREPAPGRQCTEISMPERESI